MECENAERTVLIRAGENEHISNEIYKLIKEYGLVSQVKDSEN